jgi:hypothetical protein
MKNVSDQSAEAAADSVEASGSDSRKQSEMKQTDEGDVELVGSIHDKIEVIRPVSTLRRLVSFGSYSTDGGSKRRWLNILFFGFFLSESAM